MQVSGKLGQEPGARKHENPSPSFTRRRIPQEPVRFNGALARLSFSVVLMSPMTSSSGERLAAHVARLAPAAFRFHAHPAQPPLSTFGFRSPSAIAASCLSIPRAPMQTPRFWMRRPSSWPKRRGLRAPKIRISCRAADNPFAGRVVAVLYTIPTNNVEAIENAERFA